jgi:predicted house-cleaning NTP pyrophosphatase (Maf/HAM1 superfamily)
MTNKSEEIKFRCTAFEKSVIRQKAFQTGKTVSEYCRIQSINGKIVSKPKLSDEEKEFFRTLKAHNTNFARIANLIKNHDQRFYGEIQEHLKNMKKLYSKFYPE